MAKIIKVEIKFTNYQCQTFRRLNVSRLSFLILWMKNIFISLSVGGFPKKAKNTHKKINEWALHENEFNTIFIFANEELNLFSDAFAFLIFCEIWFFTQKSCLKLQRWIVAIVTTRDLRFIVVSYFFKKALLKVLMEFWWKSF